MADIAVIAAKDCALSIDSVLRQVGKADLSGCVIVANGCVDNTAAVARESVLALGLCGEVLEFVRPLGHDVPRAIGTIYALTHWPKWSGVVYIDGDWRGTFGPNLVEFIRSGKKQRVDLLWPEATNEVHAGKKDVSGMHEEFPNYLRIWQSALLPMAPKLVRVSPSRLPLWVDRHTFNLVPAKVLYQPGLWFAHCVLAQKRPAGEMDFHSAAQANEDAFVAEHRRLCIGTAPCDSRWLGNPVGSRHHQRLLRETLIGDALEGAAVLQGRPPSRTWGGKTWLGYHSLRQPHVIDEFIAQLRSREPRDT